MPWETEALFGVSGDWVVISRAVIADGLESSVKVTKRSGDGSLLVVKLGGFCVRRVVGDDVFCAAI